MAFFLGRNGALIAAIIVVPILLGDFWAFQLSLVFLFAVASLGVGICWGQAGFLPLGQASFLGLSAYLSGLALIHFPGWWLVVLLPLSALAPGVLAYGIGLVVFHGRTESGPFFPLITLALTLLAFQIATTWNSVTGGFNGLKNIPGLPGLDGFTEAYYVAGAALVVAIALTGWLVHAPIGVLWRGLSQNERRIAFFGYNAPHLKAIAFGVSGVLAGIAGALYAPQQSIVTPVLAGFLVSADLVIWAAVGGRRSVMGPAFGAVLIGILTTELRDRITFWEVFVAGVFIIVVLYLPNGLAGIVEPVRRVLSFGKRRGPAVEARDVRTAGTPAPSLEIDGCSLRVGEVQILDDLSLSLEEPAIYCLIGPNGAGKTSTFNVLTGDLRAQRGAIRLDGEVVTGIRANALALKGVGRKFQIPSVFTDLSVSDNLHIALWGPRASIGELFLPRLRRWTSPVLESMRERFSFLADGDRTAGTLSHGERQILELAMALVAEPRLLLLDEPCAGLSNEDTQQVIDVIRWARAELDLTVVLIEHDMSLVKELADHVFVMHQGRLLADGDVAAIQSNADVQDVYVGVAK